MLSLVRTWVVRLLHDMDPYIRKTAATSCISILDRAMKSSSSTTPPVALAIKQALNHLLTAGLSDTNVEIRYHIFSSFPPSLDPFLTQTPNLGILVHATYDESFDVRSAVIKVIARLAQEDQCHVLPILRKIWVTLMEQVRDRLGGGGSEAAQKSLLLLQSLCSVEHHLVRPYVKPLLQVKFSGCG